MCVCALARARVCGAASCSLCRLVMTTEGCFEAFIGELLKGLGVNIGMKYDGWMDVAFSTLSSDNR